MADRSALPTRNDVARLAGTSPAVVSYVLNDGPRPVSAATRERVLAAVAELGYRPNRVARALRAKRTRALGLIAPDASNPFFAALARAIEDAAYADGYTLLVGNSADDPEREATYVRTFADHQVDGMAWVHASHSTESIELLRSAGTPVVLVDRALSGTEADSIVVDNESGARVGTRHLIEHGHARIGCLAGPPELAVAVERHRGWEAALHEAGLEAEVQFTVRSEFDRAGGYHAAALLLQSQRRRPTAIFASTDAQAIGALRAAAEAGLRIPDDLAIVSFDGTPEAAFTLPGLTTVEQPVAELGRRAVHLLLERIRNPDTPLQSERLSTELIRRASCGCTDMALAAANDLHRKELSPYASST
jgi:LacI family transcriptional regulator